MWILNLLGFIAAGAVFGFGVLTSSDSQRIFLNGHAILIVFGGSAAATMICFRIDRIVTLTMIMLKRIFGIDAPKASDTVEDVLQLSNAFNGGEADLRAHATSARDPFVREVALLLAESQGSVESVTHILVKQADSIYLKLREDAHKIRTISKFPPAFGLMGTTLSMIALLQKLGEPNGQSQIGPAMAIGLVATLYGIALANFVLVPMAENITQQARDTRKKNMIIIEGVKLLVRGTNSVLLTQELTAYLSPEEKAA